MPIVSKLLLYRNPSLQCWHRGRQNDSVGLLLLISPHLLQIVYLFSRHDLGLYQGSRVRPGHSSLLHLLITSCISSSLLSANRVVSSAYIKLFIFLPPILTNMSSSSRFACLMMYSLYRLNKYGERTHPCLTPFPIEKLSVSPLVNFAQVHVMARQVGLHFSRVLINSVSRTCTRIY